MNKILSALIEAWGEIKINKGRFVLSLTGVAVAVWAMATVLALGSMALATDEYFQTISGNRPGILTFQATPSSGDNANPESKFGPYGPYGPAGYGAGSDQPQFGKSADLVEDSTGTRTSKFGAAARATMADLKVTNWSRSVRVSPNIRTSSWSSKCDYKQEDCSDKQVELSGVDPIYFKFFARQLLVGRFINDADAMLQMNPVVINEKLWDNMGRPNPLNYPRIVVEGDPGLTLTVVGVVKSQTRWDQNEIFMHYDGLIGSQPRLATGENAAPDLESGELRALVPVGEEEDANDVVLATLKSQLGPNWQVESYWSGEQSDVGEGQRAIITTIVSIIGGIVIMLGAFGLLTVSIVTVRQRIREIGIRRAMGASARRVFFSVFLESVVATTAAGFTGVLLSILTIRLAPNDWLDFPIPISSIPYPMTAALLGVLIAAGVGALTGIIPAAIAVKVKPIDAIRY